MRTELPKRWHVLVKEDNKKILSEWIGVSLQIGKITGICSDINEFNNGKGHNPYGDIKGCSYDFGEEITFEEFKVLVLKEQPLEPNYEIY